MKIQFELTLTESIMVLNALTKYASSIENENEKKLVEKVKHGLRITATNAIKAKPLKEAEREE